jgi:hypothetical protein
VEYDVWCAAAAIIDVDAKVRDLSQIKIQPWRTEHTLREYRVCRIVRNLRTPIRPLEVGIQVVESSQWQEVCRRGGSRVFDRKTQAPGGGGDGHVDTAIWVVVLEKAE